MTGLRARVAEDNLGLEVRPLLTFANDGFRAG
jgi:hypothetical protein